MKKRLDAIKEEWERQLKYTENLVLEIGAYYDNRTRIHCM
jgi:hypothetical protein